MGTNIEVVTEVLRWEANEYKKSMTKRQKKEN